MPPLTSILVSSIPFTTCASQSPHAASCYLRRLPGYSGYPTPSTKQQRSPGILARTLQQAAGVHTTSTLAYHSCACLYNCEVSCQFCERFPFFQLTALSLAPPCSHSDYKKHQDHYQDFHTGSLPGISPSCESHLRTMISFLDFTKMCDVNCLLPINVVLPATLRLHTLLCSHKINVQIIKIIVKPTKQNQKSSYQSRQRRESKLQYYLIGQGNTQSSGHSWQQAKSPNRDIATIFCKENSKNTSVQYTDATEQKRKNCQVYKETIMVLFYYHLNSFSSSIGFTNVQNIFILQTRI